MAATTLAKDVLYRVSVQLTDAPVGSVNTAQFARWTERELVAWLNDGQRFIAKYLPPACSRIDCVKLASGTRQSIEVVASTSIKPSDGSTAATVHGKMLLDVIRNMGADGATPGRAVRVVQRRDLDAIDPYWHQEMGSEVQDFLYDPRTPKWFWVYPGVDPAVTLWTEIAWLANPVDVPYAAGSLGMDGTSTALISIDDQYVDDLVNYILARANMKDAESADNAALAQGYASLFVSSINAQAAALTGVNPNLKALPMNPQVMGQAS